MDLGEDEEVPYDGSGAETGGGKRLPARTVRRVQPVGWWCGLSDKHTDQIVPYGAADGTAKR